MPYVLFAFGIGFIGLFTAGMFAALMSTHDSYLLAWSGIIVQDLIASLIGRDLMDRTRIRLIRIG